MFTGISKWLGDIDWLYVWVLIKLLPGIFWKYLCSLAPYVIAGSLLGEVLKLTSWTKLIYRFVTGNKFLSLAFATALGIISPLCTFGTVPVLISLYRSGVSLPPLISFLAASSMLNPQLFIMTWGGLGGEIALIQLLCVFIFGMIIGFAVMALPERFVIRKKLSEYEPIDNKPKKEANLKILLKNTGKNLIFVGRNMLIGIAVASVVEILPLGLYIGKVNTNSVLGVITAAIAGIPMYACGGGVIPMISTLLADGLSKGSAVAFLISGPATRITSLAAITVILKKRFIILYVLILLVYAVSVGVIFI